MTDEQALATQEQPSGLLSERQIQQRQQELWRRIYANGASDDEFRLFLSAIGRTGLDPEARQIYLAQRRERVGDDWRTTRRPEVTVDGLRAIADRSPNYGGQTEPQWCGPDGVWHDVWLDREPPVAARVGVVRKDWEYPCYAVARYDSYVQTTAKGEVNATWRKMPDVMLAKCAESLALRKAFPREMSDLYTREEMGQAENPPLAQADSTVRVQMHQLGEAKAEKLDWEARINQSADLQALETVRKEIADSHLAVAVRQRLSGVYQARLAELQQQQEAVPEAVDGDFVESGEAPAVTTEEQEQLYLDALAAFDSASEERSLFEAIQNQQLQAPRLTEAQRSGMAEARTRAVDRVHGTKGGARR